MGFFPNYTHTRRLIQHMDLRKTFAAAKEKGILAPPAPPPSCCYVNPEEIRRRNSTMTAAGIDQMAQTGAKKKHEGFRPCGGEHGQDTRKFIK